MNKYTGIACAKCGTAFTDNDDIVVCPECGAPHHRECYMQEKRCALADNHGDGFEWVAKAANIKTGEKLDVIICSHCNTVNPAGSESCRMCGTRLFSGAEHTQHAADTTDRYGSYTDEYRAENGSFTDFFYREDWNFGDITAREMSAYTGSSAYYYITRFRALRENRFNISWNWAALVFGPFYFLYRKMYKMGFLLLAFIIMTMLPSFMCFMGPHDATMLMYGTTVQYNSLVMNSVAPMMAILSYMRFGVSIFTALFANKLFFQTTLKDIKRYRSFFGGKNDTAEYFNGLYFYGKPNALIVMLTIIAMFILSSAFFNFTGAIVMPIE